MRSKKILIILLLTLSLFSSLFAENKDLDFNKNLKEISLELEIPIKNLKKNLKLAADTDNFVPIVELNKSNEININKDKLLKAKKKFNENLKRFTINTSLVGMLVVFVSLLFIGFVISLLEHLHIFSNLKEKRKQRKKNKSKNKKISTPNIDHNNLSRDAVVAAITALHLHVLETERENELQLTFNRTKISMWKSYTKSKMPNIKHQLGSKK